jgi:alginate O-acetyltransferase complex protein AlgI
MDLTSLSFLAYLALAAVLYRLCPARWRATLLLFCSYAFYCAWSAQMALLLFGATTAAYFAARAIESFKAESTKRAVLSGFVSLLVLILALYKSAPFLRGLFGWNLLMPLGISYYTFKLIGYVVDVFWGKIPAEKAFLPFAAYAAFFPQITAGPIQRSESFLPQIHNPVPPSFGMVVFGVQRILLGYFKKFSVAENLALLVNFIYGHLHGSGVPLVLGYYAFPLQIYADFSGLTDIANGAAYLFGIEAPENFNAPYWALSPSDFWRRFHMSLTLWLTDYVYTPLRMSARAFGNVGLVCSVTVNTVLIGLWHGFRWNFALFGLVHAVYLSVDALTSKARRKYYKSHPATDRAMNGLGPVLTFHFIAIGLVFFRGDSVADILYLLGHIGQGLSVPSAAFSAFWSSSGRSVLVGFAAYFVMEALDYLRRKNKDGILIAVLPRWGRWAAYSCTATATLLTICMMLIGGALHNPFLYAIF